MGGVELKRPIPGSIFVGLSEQPIKEGNVHPLISKEE